jgi:hypothetical protein
MPRKFRENNKVFLNVPYDTDYEPILVAMVAALLSLGNTPELAFDDQRGGEDRLTCIVKLIQSCRFSFHDLSADKSEPPRFNMPFELGIACAVHVISSKGGNGHPFYIFHNEKYRLQKTLTDINGMDPFIHEGKPENVIRKILGIMQYMEKASQLTVSEVYDVYQQMTDTLAVIKKDNMAENCSVFDKQIFKSLVASGLVIVHDKGWK